MGRTVYSSHLNGTTDGAQFYFYYTINPRLARLSLPLILWQKIPADRVPALDRQVAALTGDCAELPRAGKSLE